MRLKSARTTAACLIWILGAACSRNEPRSESEGPTPSDDLLEVAGLLRDYTGEFQSGPTRLADVAKNEGLYPRGFQSIKSGKIVVLWGVPMPLEGGRPVVIAYEASIQSEPATVLLENGEVKRMTPDEFKATPKAK